MHAGFNRKRIAEAGPKAPGKHLRSHSQGPHTKGSLTIADQVGSTLE